MQYPYALPAEYSLDALHALAVSKGLPGFSGFAIEGSRLLALFVAPLDDADKAVLDAAIASYVYEAPPSSANYDAGESAMHSDAALDDAAMGAFYSDSKGRGNLFLVSLKFAAKSGNYARVNRVYADMVKKPPIGMTSDDVKAIAQHFIDNGFTSIEA